MAVYVDDMSTSANAERGSSHWFHLTSDSTEELTAFAVKLGLLASWIQFPGTWKERFNLTENMRQRALNHGAVEITPAQSAMLMKAKRNKLVGSKLKAR